MKTAYELNWERDGFPKPGTPEYFKRRTELGEAIKNLEMSHGIKEYTLAMKLLSGDITISELLR